MANVNWNAWNKGAAARKSSNVDLSSYGYQDVVETEVNESLPKSNKKGFGDYATSFNNKLPQGFGSAIGTSIAGIGDAYGQSKFNDSFSEEEQAAQSTIRKGLEMIPGWGQLIAAASGAVDAIGSATGTNLSSVNKEDADRAGVKGTWFNKAMNVLPGNSMIWGGLSALFGNDRTNSFNISKDALSMSDWYGATMGDLNAAQNLSNKRLFFGQTSQANNFIDSQRNNQELLAQIGKVNTQRKQSDYYQDLQHQNINRYAGQGYLGLTVGKNGMKLMSVEEARKVVALRKETKTSEPEKLQNGGNIPGIDSSILPEGSLHKELNHLDEINPEIGDITRKGIPVVTSGNDSEQVAEVESNEIVFRLEITQRLEELMKDGSEEAMIEAGKLVTTEIIENTVDNTGQITEEVVDGKE